MVMKNEEIKSNINIADNVYIETENSKYKDVASIEKITGYNASLKLSSKAQSATVQLNLNHFNEEELKRNIPCTSSNNQLNEQTFGAVKIDNEIVWSCRCENINCENYEDCMALPNSKRIDRDYINLDSISTNTTPEEILDDTIFSTDSKNYINVSPKDAENFYFDDTAFNYTKTSNLDEIIKAPINESIIVNASSGNGKTSTLIDRVIYSVENNLVNDTSNILVLCYSKSTQDYIKECLPDNCNQVLVTTLDSYATKYLFDYNNVDLFSLNFDKRIEQFNSQISQFNFSNLELVLVDELHDFQNQRAMMVLNILKKVNCGIVLFGDKCQAMYQENLNSLPIRIDVVKFYNLLNKIMSRKTLKYELMSSTLNENKLTKLCSTIRDGLLYKNLTEAKKIIKKEFEQLSVENITLEKIRPTLKSNETLAFLCKNDSEAEYVSSVFYKNKIPHNLIRNTPNKYSYNRWIADVLWDHWGDFIKKEDFIQRYTARITNDDDLASNMFDLLYDFTLDYGKTSYENQINKNDLLLNFINGKTPLLEFTNKYDKQIIVSTVLNSKGEKYDYVYLVDFDVSNIGDDSVKLDKLHEIYVALSRAKKDVKMINYKNKIDFKTSNNNHSYRTFKKYNDEVCTHFSIGDDIAIECFIRGNFKDILLGQRYMSEVVRVNDKVELILNDDKYDIYHVQNTRTSRKIIQFVGVISDEAFQDFKDTISLYNDGILPHRLYDLYISQVVTIPQNNNLDNISPQFKNSKFIIGIEISGFAKLSWNK